MTDREQPLFSSGFDDSQISHIAERVRDALDKNHELRAKALCKLLDYPWPKYRDYINHLRSKWKSDYQSKLRLNRVSFHGVHVAATVPLNLDLEVAVARGWSVANRRNGMLTWNVDRVRLGRLEWWPSTGRVLVWVRKPAFEGKAVQLLARGFTQLELITDLRVWERVRASLGNVSGTFALDLGQRVPYACVELFKESNGVKVKMGDASDPTKLEIEFCCPKYHEKAEKVLVTVTDAFSKLVGGLNGQSSNGNGVGKPVGEDYSR